jgi:acetyl esterase/lipase
MILISPYVDLTHSSPTSTIGDEFEHDTLAPMPQATPEYLPPNKPELRVNPMACPLADSKGGLPPTFYALATADRLVGENLAMVIKRIELGEKATVAIYEDQVCGFGRDVEYERPN